ncbi:Unknown protein sequence [Pseudomonas syringae pv. maculicola]|nr:Unknown protein sequence [Pseudomonas syringae pv. maculicola]
MHSLSPRNKKSPTSRPNQWAGGQASVPNLAGQTVSDPVVREVSPYLPRGRRANSWRDVSEET